jgi:hypothetical protein
MDTLSAVELVSRRLRIAFWVIELLGSDPETTRAAP